MPNKQHLIPSYFDGLIENFRQQQSNRFVHLGHWDGGESNGDDFFEAQLRLNERMIDLGNLTNGLSIVDVGCGFGGTISTINERYNSCFIMGINIDTRQIKICQNIKAKNNNQIAWQVANALALPLQNHTIDAVFCIEAMFHFQSRRDFFREIKRILKPNGLLIASDITIDSALLKEDKNLFHIESIIQEGFGPWPDFWNKEGQLSELAAGTNMAIHSYFDATQNTLPSHQFTTPQKPMSWLNEELDPVTRSALALRWLHESGWLKYHYFCMKNQ